MPWDERRRGWVRSATVAAVGLAVLAGGALAFADHHEGGEAIRGVVTAVSWTAPSAGTSGSGGTPSGAVAPWDGGWWGRGSAVGTLTVLSPTAGAQMLTVLSSTRFEVTGQALAGGLVGAPVAVRAVSVNGALDALNVAALEVRNTQGLVLRGRITAVGNGTLSVATERGVVVTAALAPTATVTLADGSAGTVADLTVGIRVAATWQVVGGQGTVVAVRVLGQDQNGNGQDH